MWCFASVWVFALVQVAVSSAGLAPSMCMTGKLLQMDSCEGDFKMGYENITINKVGENSYEASGSVTVKEIVEGPVKIVLLIYHCDEKFNKGSCRVYTEWSSDGCEELKLKKGTLYKMLTSAGGKEEKCPLQPANYHLQGYKIKVPQSAATVAATAGKIWYVAVEGKAKADEMVLCTNVWLEIENCDGPQRSFGFGG